MDAFIDAKIALRLLNAGLNGYIPVRLDPRSRANGSHQHWGKGRLVGVSGGKLIVKPPNGREEVIRSEFVKLWFTQMNFEMKKAVERILEEERQKVLFHPRASLYEKKPTNGHPTPESEAQQSEPEDEPEPEPQPVGVVETTPEANTITQIAPPLPEIVVEQEQPKPSVNVAKEDFASQLATYKKLRDELSQRASTERLGKLRQLHTDLNDARLMVEAIEGEIVAVCSELQELDIEIPLELQLVAAPEETQQIAIPPNTSNTPKRPVKNSSWCPGKARYHKPAIRDFFLNRNNQWSGGREIMNVLGETISSPSSILNPLVEEGYLDRQGQMSGTEYRLATA